MSRPLISVIVPSYNRPQHIAELLDSVLAQSFQDWEVVVAEDCSPARETYRMIGEEYARKSGGRIRMHFNAENLGYDRGFRQLVELARGRFLFVMGDDDYVAPGAFAAVADAVQRHPNSGLILRAFAWFQDTPGNVVQISRYYAEECVFPAGQKAIVAAFRRLVVMSGLVMDRDLALACATDRWDGSLFYQHWIAANILAEKDAVYIPDILVYFRRGGTPMFGMAKAERELYTPGVQPPDTHLKMIRYQLEIAADVEKRRGIPLMEQIRRDYANYMFAGFAGQAHLPFKAFYRYYRDIGKLGFDRYPIFHAWFWTISLFGARNVDRVLQAVRKRVGHTPNITSFVRPTQRPRPA